MTITAAEVLTGFLEYFDVAFSEWNSYLSSSYRSGLRKRTAITQWWKCHELYFKWESKEMVAHRSLSFSVVHSSDNCHHIALYSYRVPLFSFSERHKLVFYSSVESVSWEMRFQTRADSDFRHSLRHKYLKQCIYTMYESIFIHYTWEKKIQQNTWNLFSSRMVYSV